MQPSNPITVEVVTENALRLLPAAFNTAADLQSDAFVQANLRKLAEFCGARADEGFLDYVGTACVQIFFAIPVSMTEDLEAYRPHEEAIGRSMDAANAFSAALKALGGGDAAEAANQLKLGQESAGMAVAAATKH